jgi:hypothetical protein
MFRLVLAQFEPRASPRGKHARKNHPLLLDCGKSCCPFSKVPHSPGKSMPVDDHAFSDPIYVKVSLSLLGFDASLWGDLQHFFGEVRDWYYLLASARLGSNILRSTTRRRFHPCSVRFILVNLWIPQAWVAFCVHLLQIGDVTQHLLEEGRKNSP